MRPLGLAVLCALVICAVAVPASAGTIVLRDGSVLRGTVWRERGWAAVQSESGILRLPLWRVAMVAAGPAEAGARQEQPQPAPERPQAGAKPAPAGQPGPEPAGNEPLPARSGPPRALHVLDTRFSVDFEGVPVYQVLEFIRETTGVNMAVDAAVREDQRPVTLHLHEVKIGIVLKLALEGLDFSYTVEPGQIIYVRDESHPPMTMRVYDVRDLLLDVGDVYQRGDDDDDDGDDDDDDDDDSAEDDSSRRRLSTYARAEELIELIKLSCSRKAQWEVEPVVNEP